MRPLLHPDLVNGRFGDPALYVGTLFETDALLFDLGDITALAPRKILRITQIFVSHAHIDHFVGFDHLLRLLVGREKTVQLYGPLGFIARVHHKLQAYHWNLAAEFRNDLVFVVSELDEFRSLRTARFRLKNAFHGEELGMRAIEDGVLHRAPTYQVSAVVLEHRMPCLGFALQEAAHINVWKTRLSERGLPVGPWLKQLKRAVIENRPDDHLVRVGNTAEARQFRLGELRQVLTVTPGQKIGYVTDLADTPANRAAIVTLARDADVLFIEAAFAEADRELARDRAHLTTAAAGEIARAAGVRRIEPFHFSPRYAGAESRMLGEVFAAFSS